MTMFGIQHCLLRNIDSVPLTSNERKAIMKKLKRKQENIKLELKLEEMNLQKKIQKLSEKEFNLKKRVLRKFFSCKYKVVLYIYICFLFTLGYL